MKRMVYSALALLLAAAPASAILDENGNGLSDLWEKHYHQGELFPASFLSQADPDGDGWSNAQEAVAGTDPFNPNPPDGWIRPLISHTAAVWGDADGDEIPDILTPESITLAWPTLVGKRYTLWFSLDLAEGSWLPVDSSFIGTGNQVEYGIPLTQSDKLFWRVAVEDADSDGDGLTDAEENQLGTSPYSSDTDQDEYTDMEELQAGNSPLVASIRNFNRLVNGNGTITYTWQSDAKEGDWFNINESQSDGSWKIIFATTYGSERLPYVAGRNFYVLTLNPATDYLP